MATGKTDGSSLRYARQPKPDFRNGRIGSLRKIWEGGRIKAFQKTLLGLIIFFSATQLGLHFWPLSSLVYGIRIDYLSPTIYFLDILLILYLATTQSLQGLTLKEVPNPAGSKAGKVRPYWNLIPILLLNLLYSQNPLATLSWSFHFLLYLLFFLSLPRIYLLKSISYILPFAILFQLLLALAQVYLGHSIGGLMYYLGERSVAVGQPAVALGTFMDSVVLRAYGTFSHPNILAGWSVVVLLILFRLKSSVYLLTSATVFTTLLVSLSQSRSAALALFGLIIPFYILKTFRFRLLYYILIFFSLYTLHFTLFNPPRADLSRVERRTLQGVSLKVIQNFPIFGTGAQVSISTYPSVAPENRLLQPDHNSFTLFLSWFGLFGVLAILYSLRSLLASNFYILAPLVPLLALDHYFLTSPQGLFILLLYLQVALNYSHAQKNL